MIASAYIEDSSCDWQITNVGVSGASIASTAADISGILGGVVLYHPIVMINLGVNGMPSQVEANAKNDMQIIIDAVKGKWPSVIIYISKPWKRGYDEESDTLADWIDDIVAANSGVCFVADNESVWLKGADDGATMTSDGVHYSAAGKVEKASQMLTVLGY